MITAIARGKSAAGLGMKTFWMFETISAIRQGRIVIDMRLAASLQDPLDKVSMAETKCASKQGRNVPVWLKENSCMNAEKLSC
jgi:hypothetical protein